MFESIRLLTLDPGVSKTGVAVLEVYASDRIPTVLFVETVDGARLARRNPAGVAAHGERFTKITSIKNKITKLAAEYQVDYIVTEVPYLGRFAAAFAALSEMVLVFAQIAADSDHVLDFIRIEPSVAKKYMGVPGGSKDKSAMTHALAGHPIEWMPGYSISELDEHSIDAICVGLTAGASLY